MKYKRWGKNENENDEKNENEIDNKNDAGKWKEERRKEGI